MRNCPVCGSLCTDELWLVTSGSGQSEHFLQSSLSVQVQGNCFKVRVFGTDPVLCPMEGKTSNCEEPGRSFLKSFWPQASRGHSKVLGIFRGRGCRINPQSRSITLSICLTVSRRNYLAPLLLILSFSVVSPVVGTATKHRANVEKPKQGAERGLNAGLFPFNTWHLSTLMMRWGFFFFFLLPFLILSPDSLYHKRLSIDGRQLNLEVFDPCSQVKHHAGASETVVSSHKSLLKQCCRFKTKNVCFFRLYMNCKVLRLPPFHQEWIKTGKKPIPQITVTFKFLFKQQQKHFCLCLDFYGPSGVDR